MNILSLSTIDTPCGIGNANKSLGAAMRDAGNRYEVFAIDEDMRDARSECFDEFVRRLKSYDAVVIQHEHCFFGPGIKQSARNFTRLLERIRVMEKPCVVIFHTNFPARAKASKRFFRYFSNTETIRRCILRSINSNPMLRVVVHGEASWKSFLDFGIDREKLLKVHLPIPRVEPSVQRELKDDEITLGIFGFIAHYKGYRTALEALQHLPPRYKLVIMGGKHPLAQNDPTLNNIQRMLRTGVWGGKGAQPMTTSAAHFDLSSRVKILGFVEDLDQAFADVDIILAPYVDNFPAGSGALADALARGKPIIASATPPFVEVQNDGNCMKLVAMHAPFELANAIEELVADEAERTRLSAAAIEFSRQNSWDRFATLLSRTLRDRADASPAALHTSRGRSQVVNDRLDRPREARLL
ncbi:glycosyltransferase family 4 protein [Hyphomicrobium sp. 99]|uniref:glycosyltransferase family 4 protein n=1 Tax=Hyphomicrobium sp. 99 TaxID=1163419 RepID=UPI0005F87F1C|nr:glycosyltransferase [Hyphomicrobium sp. 99]